MEACKFLGRSPSFRSGQKRSFPWSQERKNIWTPRENEDPGARWLDRATKLLKWAHSQLLESKDTLAYLREERGLSENTIKTRLLGFNPFDVYRNRNDWGLPPKDDKKLWIPKGIVIPYFRDGTLQRIRIRTGDKTIPYYFLPGSSSMSMILNVGMKVYMVVESELDVILLSQECVNIGVVSLGSAQTRPDEYTERLLKKSDLILIALDADDPGTKEAWKWWPQHFERVKRWSPVDGKDPCEMWKKGIDLKQWINFAIEEYRHYIPREATNRHSKGNHRNTMCAESIDNNKNQEPLTEDSVETDQLDQLFKDTEEKLIAEYEHNSVDQDALFTFTKKYYPSLQREIKHTLNKLDDIWLSVINEGAPLSEFTSILFRCHELYRKELDLYLSVVNCKYESKKHKKDTCTHGASPAVQMLRRDKKQDTDKKFFITYNTFKDENEVRVALKEIELVGFNIIGYIATKVRKLS